MKSNFKSMAEIFQHEPGLAKIRKLMEQSDVVLDFFKIFPELEQTVEPLKFEKNTLYLKVENAALRSELKHQESLIKEKINKYFNNSTLVKTVRLSG